MEQKQGRGKKPEREQEGMGGGIMLDFLPSEQNDSLKDCSFLSRYEGKKREKQNTYAMIFLLFALFARYFILITKKKKIRWLKVR